MKSQRIQLGIVVGAVICAIGAVLVLGMPAGAAYLRDVPQTLVQPNKVVIQCLASGDEYFNWLHDANGYVIIQDPVTGYYTYAVEANGNVVSSSFVVGEVDPAAIGLKPNVRPSPAVISSRAQLRLQDIGEHSAAAAPTSGTINNICIFIRFSGESEFTDLLSTYDLMFNNSAAGANSMRNYYQEASYGALGISTSFYPVPPGATVVSWQDTAHTRGYFQPLNAVTNPGGYSSGAESAAREFKLLKDAVDGVSADIPAGLVVDGDGDGKCDNVCFVIDGSADGWSDLLWPHHWELSGENATINGKRVWDFNLQLQNSLASSGVGVLCHEMFHSMGAPDLYHYSNCSSNTNINPAWRWDIMDNDRNPPQHMSAYMKFRYGHWISSIPSITGPGTFTLNPLTSSTGNCFMIASPNTSDEYFVVEYRRKTGTFESSLPDSGLLVWRIRPSLNGNACGPPDGVYLYRPGGTTAVDGSPANAAFSIDLGRTAINDSTDPSSFLTDGSPGGLLLCSVGTRGDTISFKVGYTNGSLRICKYNDLNLNSTFDAGEELAAWPFEVRRSDGTLANSVSTGPDGCVTVSDLPEDTYTVLEKVPTPDVHGNFSFQGHRWHAYTPLSQKIFVSCGDSKEIVYRDVCLGSITACKFHDCDMNGLQGGGESGIGGWPMRLAGTLVNGDPAAAAQMTTDSSGCAVFADLFPGTYSVSEEGGGIAWEKVATTCGATSYCDWRTTWAGKRWQATAPRPPDDCSLAAAAPAIGSIAVSCSDKTAAFGNVPLGTVTAYKNHDLNMNGTYEPSGEPYADSDGNGAWTPGEQFTDLNCNGVWNSGEFFVDSNNNGTYDPHEPFTDLDGDHAFDFPECPIQGWPFTLGGTRGDGRPVCFKGVTDGSGALVLQDVPPAAGSYTLREDVIWTQVVLPTETVYRTTHPAQVTCGCSSLSTIDRWEATTPIEVQFPLDCGASHSSSFGNVCLGSVDGVKEVYTQGMPGQAPKDPDASGWHICLAGKDVKGRDVVPTLVIGPPGGPAVLVPAASKAPISVPCLTPKWYEIATPPDGSFHFLDLPPGHYHLTEQPDHPGFRLDMDRPMMSGFDVMCCSEQVVMRNIAADLPWNVYQAYCGDSKNLQQGAGGLKGGVGDPITAVPGVLAFDSGPGWRNFVRATEMCREARITNVTLRKLYQGNVDCPDYFAPVDLRQQGGANITDWWPLMYEPPTTNWTLTVTYDTATPVQFPGETRPSVHHQDKWRWTVATDIEHMKNLIDLLHEVPAGNAQKPVLSNDALAKRLKAQLDEVDALVKAGQKGEAGMKLDTFILDLEDYCITDPCMPIQYGFGIMNTLENPACCKLLLDAEYIGNTLELWHP